MSPTAGHTAAIEPWTEHAERVLREAGRRSSAPRSAIVEVLGRQDCVLTAQEIIEEVRAGGGDVGIATVYRALDLLEDLGLAQRLDFGEGAPARYEPAHPSGEHHHHLVCGRCGRVSAFEDPQLERAIDHLARRVDYEIGAHDVILRGDCPVCLSDTARA